jgi:hypothetical protein
MVPESLGTRQDYLPGSILDRHIGGAVSQTHFFVLVLRNIGQLHNELMTLAVQGFWLESQLVAKMELP